jgi:hypothetical protein
MSIATLRSLIHTVTLFLTYVLKLLAFIEGLLPVDDQESATATSRSINMEHTSGEFLARYIAKEDADEQLNDADRDREIIAGYMSVLIGADFVREEVPNYVDIKSIIENLPDGAHHVLFGIAVGRLNNKRERCGMSRITVNDIFAGIDLANVVSSPTAIKASSALITARLNSVFTMIDEELKSRGDEPLGLRFPIGHSDS